MIQVLVPSLAFASTGLLYIHSVKEDHPARHFIIVVGIGHVQGKGRQQHAVDLDLMSAAVDLLHQVIREADRKRILRNALHLGKRQKLHVLVYELHDLLRRGPSEIPNAVFIDHDPDLLGVDRLVHGKSITLAVLQKARRYIRRADRGIAAVIALKRKHPSARDVAVIAAGLIQKIRLPRKAELFKRFVRALFGSRTVGRRLLPELCVALAFLAFFLIRGAEIDMAEPAAALGNNDGCIPPRN